MAEIATQIPGPAECIYQFYEKRTPIGESGEPMERVTVSYGQPKDTDDSQPSLVKTVVGLKVTSWKTNCPSTTLLSFADVDKDEIPYDVDDLIDKVKKAIPDVGSISLFGYSSTETVALLAHINEGGDKLYRLIVYYGNGDEYNTLIYNPDSVDVSKLLEIMGNTVDKPEPEESFYIVLGD